MLPVSSMARCFLTLNADLFKTNFTRVVRNLYCPASLGVDNYIQTRGRIKSQFQNNEGSFKEKMKDFANGSSSSMIFTEDLKHVIHIVEDSPDDIDLVKNMMIKFCQQNNNLRFGSFIFGPVVMRMYYYLNKPSEAFEVFMTPELEGFFDQLVSFQILMDLLLKNKMYEQVLNVFDVIKKKQLQGSKYPKNVIVLVSAACYYLNTPESFDYIKHLWTEINSVGHQPMRRAGTFAAALALQQNAPDVALEILTSMKQQTYVTIRNLKAAALADLGRPDDALPILRAVLEADVVRDIKHTFSEEIIQRVKKSISDFNNPEVTREFERIEKQLRASGNISSAPLSDQLCSEISTVGTFSNKERSMSYNSFERKRSFPSRSMRPGLRDLN